MDHYTTLGVTQDAIPEVIKAAYRAMSQKYHPDRNQGDALAKARMQAINAAYAVLSCPDERARYDRTLSAAESHNKSSRQTYADGEPTRDFSSNSSEGEEYEQTPYKSDNPMGSGPMPVAPEPIRLLRSGEYAALIVFTLITVLIFAKGQAGQTRGQPPATPATAAALIPVPPAPPRRDNQPAPLSIPAAKNSAVSSIKVLKAPNGAPWPTTSGYLEGYDSSDYGGPSSI